MTWACKPGQDHAQVSLAAMAITPACDKASHLDHMEEALVCARVGQVCIALPWKVACGEGLHTHRWLSTCCTTSHS